MPKPRTGRYRNAGNHWLPPAGVELPAFVLDAMTEADPAWDWFECGGWMVLRIFADGKETNRIAGRVQARNEWL